MMREKSRLRIALLTSLDPKNRKSWSGTIYYLAQALQKQCGEVTYIGPMDAPFEMLLGKILHGLSQFFLKKSFMYYHGTLVAKRYAKVAAKRLTQQAFDVIVAPTGAPETAFLKTDIPIILVQDATFALLHNYYPLFSNLLTISFKELDTIDDLAIEKAKMAVYTSAWAAQSAIEKYHANAKKVRVLPIGANLEEIPSDNTVQAKKKSAQCKLLFIGVDWQRKGGDIAFETLLCLGKMGVQAELIVCGCIPPKTLTHEKMRIIPFLDKNDEAQRKELEQLFVESHFLLLPTRHDCTPVVFCEANAFGLPVIATDTGGISSIITNAENGFLLPYCAKGDAYAEVIASIYRNDQLYNALIKSSRMAFENRLNWDVWGISMKQIMDEVLENKKSSDSITPTHFALPQPR